jgi:competence protein ComEC
LYEKILQIKEGMVNSINQNFSPPHSVLLQGILLGNNKTMTQDLRDKLNGTGLRYLTAISGLHVIILGEIVVFILLGLGLWRQQAFCLAIVFVWLYVIMTGFPASGIRAGIMGSVFLLSQVFGRQNTSTRTITIAAVIMLLQNPLLLLYDVGFQLSFLASMGIIHVKPLFDVLLKKIFHGEAIYLSNIIAITFAAQILTIPIMVFNFGTISLIAPLTNILIVPVMYFIMLSGFFTSVAGMISSILGLVFSVPAWILITYFLKIMDMFYQPWAVVQWQNVSWLWLVGYYFLLLVLIWWLNKRFQPEFLEY